MPTITDQDILNDAGEVDEQKVAYLLNNVAAEDRPKPEKKAEEGEKQTTRSEDKKARSDDSVEPAEKPEGNDDDWVSAADIRGLLEDLGYTADDIADFQNRDEFLRHVRLVDRQFARDGREALKQPKPGESQQEALNAQEEAQKREQARERAAQQPRENGRFVKTGSEQSETAEGYVPQLDADEVNEDIVKEFQRLGGYYENRLRQLESHYEKRAFDVIVDSLGYTDLFGKTGDANAEQAENREKLLDASETLRAGIAARRKGGSDLTESLVRRAANLEFADYFSKKQQQSFHDRVRRQAARKFGGGSQRGHKSQWDGDPARNPELLAAYRAMEAENG